MFYFSRDNQPDQKFADEDLDKVIEALKTAIDDDVSYVCLEFLAGYGD